MKKSHSPINAKCPHLLHGGDYNPDQWQHMPEIIDEDFRLMKLARTNAMSIGIFAWSALEPEEGKYEFGWLDDIMDRLAKNSMFAVLATPSGARPAWLSHKYPEILRVNESRVRLCHGGRHNHCFTSPVYREKTLAINTRLAERYKEHPALLIWHVSNEYGGECHCALCQTAFRNWLKNKFNSDLDALNKAYWTAFWSHTFSDWSQIESPSPIGEIRVVHGLSIDWRRFVTHQTVNFMEHEIAPLKRITPRVPVTTNFMGTYPGLNYFKFKKVLDVVSWDSYPRWHAVPDNLRLASDIGFLHDLNRSILHAPFMLMESAPGTTNWMPVCKLKRPGMDRLASLQAVAHGSDTVQYFQWRKSRGACEKFHGAVVDHAGHENTRIFKTVAEVGQNLAAMDAVVGSRSPVETAIIYDWENRWALEDLAGLRNDRKDRDYETTCRDHYQPLWQLGVPADVIDMEEPLAPYRLVIAPMLYMLRAGFEERITGFVKKGGTFVATYWTGAVDENDLCFLGGFPGPLRKLLGIWAEEMDALTDDDVNGINLIKGNALKMKGRYQAGVFCERIHTEGAEVLATYADDFYKGEPALTVNRFGKGEAFYIASRNEARFTHDFLASLVRRLQLTRAVKAVLPVGVTAQLRTDGKNDFVFLQNYNSAAKNVNLGGEKFTDMLHEKPVPANLRLEPYGVRVLRRNPPPAPSLPTTAGRGLDKTKE